VLGAVETVEWSGKTESMTIAVGGAPAVQRVPVHRGPPSNLSVSSLDLDVQVLSILEGDSVLVTPTVVTAAADTPTIFGSSSDTTVAKIDSTGVERALGPGGAQVVAEAGPLADTVAVTVFRVPSRLVLVPDSISVDSIPSVSPPGSRGGKTSRLFP